MASSAEGGDAILPLNIPEAELEIGRVYESSLHEHTFHITNTNDRPITITGFERTCDCLGIAPEGNVTLQGHESKPFSIKLSPRPETDHALDKGYPYSVRFAARYRVNDEEVRSAQWQLNCTVVPTIRYKPTVIRIGTQSDRREGVQQSAAVEAAPDIHHIETEAPDAWAVEILNDSKVQVPSRFTVSVKARKTLPRGSLSNTVYLYPIDQTGNRLPRSELMIVGNIVPDIGAVPGEIQLGRKPCGTIVEEAVRLRSILDRPFRVVEVTSNSDDLVIQPLGSGEGPHTYTLRLSARRTGEQETIYFTRLTLAQSQRSGSYE